MRTFQPYSIASIAIVAFASTIRAHTWVEQMNLIASNGTFIGTPGYPRGFIGRNETDFADANLINLIPPNGVSTGNVITSDMLMCRESQFIGNQTEDWPALKAAPGDQIALIYEENGHVTKLSASPTKPVGSGTIYIYGTKQPANTDTYLGIHRVWNTDGTGGDKRGKLLATRPFDNGQCFQNSTQELAEQRRIEFHPEGNDLKCQSDVQMPDDAGTSGQYTLYWVWEWPTLDTTTGAVVTNESYTSCMDIDMTSEAVPSAGSFATDQVIDFAAIEDQVSTAYLVNPTISEQLTGAATIAPSAGASSAMSSQASGISSQSAQATSVSSLSAQITPAVSQLSSVTNSVPGGFITVTVTAGGVKAETATMTVTKIITSVGTSSISNPVSSSAPGTYNTIPSAPSSSTPISGNPVSSSSANTVMSSHTAASTVVSSSAPYQTSGVPALTPFLPATAAAKRRSRIMRGM